MDADTNLYASVEGTVIKLGGDGVPLQTNSICPRPGIAQRDPSGNYYFAGLLPGHVFNGLDTMFDPQDFGGIVLSNMPVYIAKYSSAGVLIWATNIGPATVRGIGVLDFVLSEQGDLVVSFRYMLSGFTGFQTTAKFNSNGIQGWSSTVGANSDQGAIAVRMTPYSSTNFYSLKYFSSPGFGALLTRFDTSGAGSGIANWNSPFSLGNIPPPVILNFDGDLYNVEGNPNVTLTKRAPNGTVQWSVNTGTLQRGVGPDQHGGVHVASDTTTNLLRYDYDGNLAWTRSLPARCLSLLLDANGNRFLSLSGGIIARLEAEAPPESPYIVAGPQTQIVALGSNVAFSVTATGTPTLRYQWRKDGTNVVAASATNSIVGVTTNDVGSYVVVVTNLYGSVTSVPAALLVSPSLLSPYVGAVGLWGQQATLSVSAWGSGTLTYQWYKAGQLITDATNSTLIFPSVQISDAGAYSVVVTSAYGSVTNIPADLVVNPANIALGLYAGITIEGTIGYSYGIEYATNLQNATWYSLTNITLTRPVEIWVDTSVQAITPKRFYRVTGQ